MFLPQISRSSPAAGDGCKAGRRQRLPDSLGEEFLEIVLMFPNELLVTLAAVVAYIRAEVSCDLEEIAKTLEGAREEIAPLPTLALRLAAAVEMNHLAEVRIVPATKGHPRDEILAVDKAKGLGRKKAIVGATEIVQTDPRLAESVDAANRSDNSAGKHRKDSAAERGERAAQAVAGDPQCLLPPCRNAFQIFHRSCDRRQNAIHGLDDFLPGMAEREGEAGVHFAHVGRSGEKPGKTTRRGMEVGHPILEILGPAKSDRGKVSAADEEGGGILHWLFKVEPFEVGEAHLGGEPASVRFRPVSKIAELGQEERILRAESCRVMIEVRHRSSSLG